MRKIILPVSGIQISPLAFGGNVFGWTLDQARSWQMLDAFVEYGFNFIDTADVYSRWVPGNKGGESETIIGAWMKQRANRDKVVIATKVGKEMGAGKKGLSPTYIRDAIENSLQRLQTDYIDLYQSHDDDLDTPMESTMATFDALIREGKVRAIGASNFLAERLALSLEVCKQNSFRRYETLQPLYNLYDRSAFEDNLEPLCAKEQIGVIPYYSLASGFLTGKYRSELDLVKSPRGQGNRKFLNDRGFRILKALDQVAGKFQESPATIAIAWLMTRPSVVAPIASATSKEQLSALVQSERIELDRDSLDLLNQASA
jgi:aryl-alcohol dehydrogenase-like predicted oxidoreductase